MQNCLLREGDTVKAGEVLLAIGRSKTADAMLKSAQQNLIREEQELRRVEQLVKSGAIPGEEIDKARASWERARAQLAKAEETLTDYQIRAPWDGVVSKVLVTDGDYVTPRTTLVEVFDPRSLVIRFAVPEKQAMSLNKESRIQATFDAYPGRTFQPRVVRIYPELDRRMRTRTVEAIVAESVTLAPGMFARLTITVKEVADAIVVPANAAVTTPSGARIAYVFQDGKLTQRKLETGIEEGGRIQIVSGLKAGEQVVLGGQARLKDGMAVVLLAEASPPQNAPAKGQGRKP